MKKITTFYYFQLLYKPKKDELFRLKNDIKVTKLNIKKELNLIKMNELLKKKN